MSLGSPPVQPDAVALPQALQAMQAELAARPQQPPAGGQPAPAAATPQAPTNQPGQPPAAAPAPVDPMQDADLARFFVEVDQPATPQQQQNFNQPPGQTPGFAPTNTAPPGAQPTTPPVPQGFDPTWAASIQRAQMAMMEAIRQNAAGAAQAQPGPGGQQEAQPTGLEITLADVQFTPEEQQALSGREALFEKLFQRFTKQQLEPILKKIADANNTTMAQLGRIEQNSAAAQQQTVRQIIAARVPDFEMVIAQPNFRTFVQEMVPEVGVTRGDIIREAVRRGDISLIHHHVSQYKAKYGGQGPDGGQAMLTMQQPAAQPRAPQAAPGQQPTRRVTEETLLQAEGEMTRGRLSPAKFEKLVDLYRQQTQAAQRAPTQMGFRPA